LNLKSRIFDWTLSRKNVKQDFQEQKCYLDISLKNILRKYISLCKIRQRKKRLFERKEIKKTSRCILHQWFPKSAPWTTSGPRDWLKWSANPCRNQYFVLRGPPNDSKGSAHQKSLGTTVLHHTPDMSIMRSKNWMWLSIYILGLSLPFWHIEHYTTWLITN